MPREDLNNLIDQHRWNVDLPPSKKGRVTLLKRGAGQQSIPKSHPDPKVICHIDILDVR